MQYQEKDQNGVIRFVDNKLIIKLLDSYPGGLNALCCNDSHFDDYDQLLQLIGYSASGIPYRDEDKYDITDSMDNPEEVFEKRFKEAKEKLAPIVSDMFNIAIEDLMGED